MMDKAEQNITVDYKYFLGTCSTQNKRLTINFKVIHSQKSVFDCSILDNKKETERKHHKKSYMQ